MDDAELRAILAAQARLIAELSERLAPTRKSVPLGELYAHHEAARKARPAWYSVKAMLLPFVDRYRERDAAGLVVQDWMAYREARTAPAQPENGVITYSPLSPSSRNLTLAYVKSMLRAAVKTGLLDVEPKLCAAPTEKQKDHRETAPNEDDVQRLLAHSTKPRERVIVLCACDSGMRRNEIRQLQWSWINRERREIRLPNWACKGERGRVVPATPRELAAIDNMPRDIRSPYVLRNAKGNPYAVQMFTNWARALATAAGLQAVPGEERVHLHDLRHGYATNAVERGARIEVVSEILGHASLEQTRAYVQSRPRDLEAAREAFESGIKPTKR